MITVWREPLVVERDDFEYVFSTLTNREVKVILLRFGFDGTPKTLKEVGLKIYVSRERVRQIEAKAIRKLRHPSRSMFLQDFSTEKIDQLPKGIAKPKRTRRCRSLTRHIPRLVNGYWDWKTELEWFEDALLPDFKSS